MLAKKNSLIHVFICILFIRYFQVMFIDYGDYRVVELKNLREIVDETLQNIPQYSIQCSLCGVSNLTMVSFGMAELCYSSLMYRNKS